MGFVSVSAGRFRYGLEVFRRAELLPLVLFMVFYPHILALFVISWSWLLTIAQSSGT